MAVELWGGLLGFECYHRYFLNYIRPSSKRFIRTLLSITCVPRP